MRIWLLGAGVGLLVLTFPTLPVPTPAVQAGFAVAGCLLLASRRGWIVSGFLLGLAWSAHDIRALLDARLPACIARAEQALIVEILKDPEPLANPLAGGASVRVRALVKAQIPTRVGDDGQGDCAGIVGAHLRLAWYGSPGLQRGEVWALRTRLKPPWGYQNPGGFDFERWLLSQRLQGTGYVVQGTLLEAVEPGGVAGFRDHLRRVLSAGHLTSGGILYALVSGDGSHVTAEQWRDLRATGTIHLMVVSGLHVGLVAALAHLLGEWLLRLLPPVLLWLPARRAGALAAMLGAGSFVVFTGSGVPGVRALCMVCVAMLAVCLGRRISIIDVIVMALVVVLVLDPVAVHQQGFWLSFCAVTTLAGCFAGRHRPATAWWGPWSTQLALFIGLTPLLAALVGQVSLVAVLANLLAVPVVSLVVIPLALCGAVLLWVAPELAGFGFYVADHALRLLMRLLDALASVAPVHVAPPPWLVAGTMAAAAMLLRGAAWRSQVLLWLLWLCWLSPPQARLRDGEFRVIALDVGQGSAILVDTRDHRLLFDAGPRFPSGFDLGAAVVVPSIGATGARRLDAMVLSHSDIDHRGGMDSVLAALAVTSVFESEPSHDSERCTAGRSWRWNGVAFNFLSPSPGTPAANDNDGSCVLEIANSRERVLLPGDVSAHIERKLVRRSAPVRLLFAPHHGSKTSSSPAFVRILHPDIVFVSAGNNNRYGHPHAAVVKRYRDIGAGVHVTGAQGALVWESRKPREVYRYRIDRKAYWTSNQ